ncbi:MAG: hypothetical protein KDB44_03165 [Mycobacterium sp.]|nr:hypothetical protein [Mycobacterium sp.]
MRPTLDLDVGSVIPHSRASPTVLPGRIHPHLFRDRHIHLLAIGVILVMVSGVTMVTLAVEGGVPEFTAASTPPGEEVE